MSRRVTSQRYKFTTPSISSIPEIPILYTIGSLRCIGLAVVNQQLLAGRPAARRASPQRSTKQKNGLGPADTETTPPYCSFYLIYEGLEFTRDLGFSGRNLGLYRQATERR